MAIFIWQGSENSLHCMSILKTAIVALMKFLISKTLNKL